LSSYETSAVQFENQDIRRCMTRRPKPGIFRRRYHSVLTQQRISRLPELLEVLKTSRRKKSSVTSCNRLKLPVTTGNALTTSPAPKRCFGSSKAFQPKAEPISSGSPKSAMTMQKCPIRQSLDRAAKLQNLSQRKMDSQRMTGQETAQAHRYRATTR